ncbi:histidine phosphatase family protein [Arthrobacter sp.]|uniref:histidine phosphatase family protein n=1 Tax=Arthrobacter sp. TaxID=1667 RepID=UPI00339974D4
MAAGGPHDFPVLWLMRHGETEWSRDHRYTGLTDLELTPAGVQQARDAAAKLAGVRFHTVLTSPLVRARRTAELAGYPEAEAVPEAREWDYGDYEGLQSVAIRAKDPSYLIWTHGVRGGETLQQVADRADHVIAKILDGGHGAALSSGTSDGVSAGRPPAPGTTSSDMSEPRQVLLVAHGHLLRVLAARWLGMEPVEGRHFVLDTAAVCRLGWDKETPAIAGWNL